MACFDAVFGLLLGAMALEWYEIPSSLRDAFDVAFVHQEGVSSSYFADTTVMDFSMWVHLD